MNTEDINCNTTSATQQGLLRDLSPEQLETVENVRKSGGKVFFIKINFQPETPAKSLKVMLIENKLSKLGEIVRSWPTVNEVEDDNHSFTLFIIFCTNEEKDIVGGNVNVDCVEKVFIKQL
jgi:two-component system chemotaxis sensor kinase CheA